jgi:hypothetical protein
MRYSQPGEDYLGDTSTLADPSVVDDLKEARSQSYLSGRGELESGGAAVRRSLYVNLTGVTPLRSQRTAGAALAVLEVRRLVRRTFLVRPDELVALAATEGRIRPAPPPGLVS